jgi:hypothetical protein
MAVLGAFVLAFLGPWGTDHESYRISFPNVALDTFDAGPTSWAILIVGAILLAPIACLGAVLRPSLRPAHVLYRVVLGVAGVPLVVLLGLLLLATHDRPGLEEAWGLIAYAGTLILAIVVEILPARPAPERDYSEVFR